MTISDDEAKNLWAVFTRRNLLGGAGKFAVVRAETRSQLCPITGTSGLPEMYWPRVVTEGPETQASAELSHARNLVLRARQPSMSIYLDILGNSAALGAGGPPVRS